MQRTGRQLERIQQAILQAYTPDELSMIVLHSLDKSLAEITTDANFTTQVFALVGWADRNGRLPELVAAACDGNPGNGELKRLRDDFAWWQVVAGAPPALAAELTRLYAVVAEHFGRWQNASLAGQGAALLDGDRFIRVDAQRKYFAGQSKELRAYLLRCAVQNAPHGVWAEWLLLNLDNERIVPPLILALNAVQGRRPAWRAAAILARIFDGQIALLFDLLDAELRHQVETGPLAIEDHVLVIDEAGVERFLHDKANDLNLDDKERRSARQVLDELHAQRQTLDDFAGRQEVRQLWFAQATMP